MGQTTIYVKNQGLPVEGASVIAGELNKTKVTDAEGKIQATLPDGYDVVMDICVVTGDANQTITTMRITDGEEYTINLDY